MARRPFIRRKKNETKNQEAMDTFRLYNRLAPSTRSKYESVIEDFGDFLEIHNKSLWDADFEDLKKFLLEEESDASRSIVSTFYRVLIDSGEFKKENPVIQLNRIEREQRQEAERAIPPPSRAEKVLSELDEEEETTPKQTRLARTERRKIGKRIMTQEDLDRLTRRASHIRDRAILEFLFATGAQLIETVNLNMGDVDLEARQVTIYDNTSDEENLEYRVLILPRRTVNFLKVYERWRRRQLSSSQSYFVTKSTKKRMSDSSISTWLNRIQKDLSDDETWTAMDFRKRALLQHYWVTRDLTAVARFGGYKRPESALNLISDVLEDFGVDSIDKLASLPEFEELKSNKKRLASIDSDDQMTITIQLDKDEMDIIRNSGLTPTQAVRTIISLKDLYGAFGGGGGGGSAPASSSEPSSSSSPSGGPKLGGKPASGPKLGGAPTSGPNLSASPSSGPNLSASPSAGPNLSKSPAAGPDLSSVKLSSAPSSSAGPSSGPSGAGPGGPDRPSGGPGGGGAPPGGGSSPMSQLAELKQILAARRAKSEEPDENDKRKAEQESGPSPLGGRIEDVGEGGSTSGDGKDDDDEDKEDEEIPELPDFNI